MTPRMGSSVTHIRDNNEFLVIGGEHVERFTVPVDCWKSESSNEIFLVKLANMSITKIIYQGERWNMGFSFHSAYLIDTPFDSM